MTDQPAPIQPAQLPPAMIGWEESPRPGFVYLVTRVLVAAEHLPAFMQAGIEGASPIKVAPATSLAGGLPDLSNFRR